VLAGIADLELPADEGRVPVAQSGGAEAFVLFRIFFIADAHVGLEDQAHDCGDDRFGPKLAAGDIPLDPLAELRQRAAECGQPLIFAGLPLGPEIGMISILLPPPVVEADRLDVAIWIRAEPAALVSGREADPVQPVDRLALGDSAAVRREILEVAAAPFAGDPGEQ
jgi:hypothetical protein